MQRHDGFLGVLNGEHGSKEQEEGRVGRPEQDNRGNLAYNSPNRG